jgi:hypothetical protein
MLLHCDVSDEYTFFERVWKLLTDDIKYNFQNVIGHPDYRMTDIELKDHLIYSLTILFYKSGGNINDFKIPKKSLGSSSYQDNRFIDEELTDDIDGLLASSKTMISQLNAEQREAFNIIIDDILHSKGGFYFVSGYGGTGKTFL